MNSAKLSGEQPDRSRGVMDNQTGELTELVKDWASAELRGDTALLERTLANDFVGVGPRGFTLTREQWLLRRESGNLKYASFRLDEVELRFYGDTAIAVCRESAEGVYEGEGSRHEIREQFRATLVFVEQRERWLLAALQLSPILGRPRVDH